MAVKCCWIWLGFGDMGNLNNCLLPPRLLLGVDSIRCRDAWLLPRQRCIFCPLRLPALCLAYRLPFVANFFSSVLFPALSPILGRGLPEYRWRRAFGRRGSSPAPQSFGNPLHRLLPMRYFHLQSPRAFRLIVEVAHLQRWLLSTDGS